VPQHRERIFIVGTRDDVGFNLGNISVPEQQFGPRMEAILHTNWENSEGDYVVAKGKVNPKYTLSAHLWTYLKDYAAKHRAKGNGFGFGLVTPLDVARTLSARYYKDGSEILVTQPRRRPRRLTPRECARLMGFVENPNGDLWRIPVSDTQAYKQFGNALVPPVAKAVGEYLLPFLYSDTRPSSLDHDLTLVHA
jgi:DNA (cytosine-5)-methyltransferase 1